MCCYPKTCQEHVDFTQDLFVFLNSEMFRREASDQQNLQGYLPTTCLLRWALNLWWMQAIEGTCGCLVRRPIVPSGFSLSLSLSLAQARLPLLYAYVLLGCKMPWDPFPSLLLGPSLSLSLSFYLFPAAVRDASLALLKPDPTTLVLWKKVSHNNSWIEMQ